MMIFVYAVLVFLVLRFSVTLFNFLSNPKLGYYGKHFTDQVSIIILSASTDQDIQYTLDAIELQEYQNIEVIVQQQESEDELAERAQGKYLLFLEAGNRIHRGMLNNLIYRVRVFDLAVLSLVPTYVANGMMEKCMYPLNDFLLLNLLPLRLVRLSGQPAFAAGNIGCMFFDARLYKQHRWYKRTGFKSISASEIIKSVKQQQLKAEVLLANRFMTHHVERKELGHFSHRLLAHFGNSIPAALIYLVLVVVGPLAVFFSFNLQLAVLPFGLIFLSRVMIAFLTGQHPIVQVLLHPLQMMMLFVLLLKAVWKRVSLSFKPDK